MAGKEISVPGIGSLYPMTDLRNVGAYSSETMQTMHVLPDIIGKLPKADQLRIVQEGPILELCCGSGFHLWTVAKLHTLSEKPIELIGVDVNTSIMTEELKYEHKKHPYDPSVIFRPVQQDVFEFLAAEIERGNTERYPLIMFFAAHEIIDGYGYDEWKGYVAETRRTFFTVIKQLLHPNGVFVQGYSAKYNSLIKDLGMRQTGSYSWQKNDSVED